MGQLSFFFFFFGGEIYLSLTKKKVYWKKNIFLLPSGQSGKCLIDEISRLMNEWIHKLPLKDIAFKAIIVMLTFIS